MSPVTRTTLTAVITSAVLAAPAFSDPDTGTISETNTSLTYVGGPYSAANPSNNIQDEPDCDLVPDSCDDFVLTIDLQSGFALANPGAFVRVRVAWPTPGNDFDVYFQNPTTGARVAEPAATSGNPEIGVLPAVDGTVDIRIRILAYAAANESFETTIDLITGVTDTPVVGTYAASTDLWSCNTHLVGAALDGTSPGAFDHSGDAEPAMGFNKNGKLFAGGIAGVPAGNGLWTTNDACAQAFDFYGAVDAGIGGGDIDIELAPELNVLGNYNVYTSSLTLANITSSFSADDGVTFTSVTPVSTPSIIDDRQWNAAHGPSIVYLSYRNGITQPGNKLEVVRLDYTGLAAPAPAGPFIVWTPDQLLESHDLGNITTDRRTHANNSVLMSGPDGQGNVYQGYVTETSRVMISVSKDFGVTWTPHLVWDGGPTEDFTFWFTWQVVDDEGNVYVTWSNGANIYYSVSTDQAETWSPAVRVNRGGESRTCIYAQVHAISPGKLVFTYYGHDLGGTGNPGADWKVFMSRTSNALDPVPHFEERIVSDRSFHSGQVCFQGLACECCRELLECFDVDINPVDGGAAIVYGSQGAGSYVTRQLTGASFVDGMPDLARGEQCPSPESECLIVPPVGDPCVCPGVIAVVDLDEEDLPPAPTGDTNIQFVTVQEPFDHPAGSDVIGFSVVVDGLDPSTLPPNTFWRVIFNNPGGMWYVRVVNCAAGGVTGDYGNFDVGSVQLGPLDDFEIRDDGTICMWINRASVGNPSVGQTITGINADCRASTGNCPGGPAAFAPLDVTNSGQYAVVGNDACRTVPVLVEGFGATLAGSGVDVSWRSSARDDIRAFVLYRSRDEGGQLTHVHTAPMGTGGRFLFHDANVTGTAHYELHGELTDGTQSLLARTSVVGAGNTFAFAVSGSPLRSGTASFRYHLPEEAAVHLTVFDVAGRHVATLVEATQPQGGYAVTFDRSVNGKPLAAGVYLVRFEAGTFSERDRLIVLE